MDYYGAQTPLKQLAGISVPDSSMLVVQPYDTGAMDEIERAILESDLGINPTNDGKILRLNIPQLTAVSLSSTMCDCSSELSHSIPNTSVESKSVKAEPAPGISVKNVKALVLQCV